MNKIRIVLVLLLGIYLMPVIAEDDYRVLNMSPFMWLDYSGDAGNTWVKVITNQNDWELFFQERFEKTQGEDKDYCGLLDDGPDCVDVSPIPVVNFEDEQVIIGGIGHISDREYLVVIDVNSEISEYLLITVAYLNSFCDPSPPFGVDSVAAITVAKTHKPIRASLVTAQINCQTY
jgi:hypothetical protein